VKTYWAHSFAAAGRSALADPEQTELASPSVVVEDQAAWSVLIASVQIEPACPHAAGRCVWSAALILPVSNESARRLLFAFAAAHVPAD